VNAKYTWKLNYDPNTEIIFSLESAEKKVEIDMLSKILDIAPSGDVVSTFQKTFYDVTVNFPKAGSYNLMGFVRERGSDNKSFIGCYCQKFIYKS